MLNAAEGQSTPETEKVNLKAHNEAEVSAEEGPPLEVEEETSPNSEEEARWKATAGCKINRGGCGEAKAGDEDSSHGAQPSATKEQGQSDCKPAISEPAEVMASTEPCCDESAKTEAERRWCPDTWWWYTFSELKDRYNKRYSETELVDHWNWKMQHAGGTGADDTNESSWGLSPSLDKFPHGVVHLTRTPKSSELWPCRYLLFKPPGFEETKSAWPMLIFLHGHFEIGKPEYIASMFTGTKSCFDDFALKNFVILVPLAERHSGLLHRDGHEFDIDMLARVTSLAMWRLKGRVDRVSVTGYSMGADAAAQWAARYPGFASVALFAGAYEWFKHAKTADAPYLQSVEVRCFHNDLDRYVNVESANHLISFLADLCGCPRLTERTISVPYPSNVLSFQQQMSALSTSTADVQIRISECDGGSKASWVLRDAKHLSDAHVCWPIVYANESTFGLFHWMLRCRSGEERRLWPTEDQRQKLSLAEACGLLDEAQTLCSSQPLLHEFSKELAKRLGHDKFLCLAHMQRVIEVMLVDALKIRYRCSGMIEINAALSDHLIVRPEEQDNSKDEDGSSNKLKAARQCFQDRWDAVRRNLYGTLYHDCWLPCEERGAEPVYQLPSEEAAQIREGSRFVSSEVVASKLERELKQRIRKHNFLQLSQRRAKIIAAKAPKLEVEQALDMQVELRNGFASPGFQDKLKEILTQHAATPLKVTLLRAEIVWEVQKDVLVKYGFEPKPRSIPLMLKSLRMGMREFQEVGDECNYLLGAPSHYNNPAPEEVADTARRSEEWKDFFRNGGWEAAADVWEED